MTSRRATARAAIATVARALAGESPGVVFVGGTVTALYPLEGGVDVRPTADVDCVVDLATTAESYAFVERLRARGFRECTDEGAPLCRRVFAEIRVDIVSTTDTGIGPSTRWCRDAVEQATTHRVAADLEVRAITPIFFVATKLEAFRDRGGGDYLASHAVEDTLTVLAGLAALRDEIATATTTVAHSMRSELIALRAKEACGLDRLPNYLDETITAWLYAKVLLALLMQRMGVSGLPPPEEDAARRRRRHVEPAVLEARLGSLAGDHLGAASARTA